ncbi:hypothetical protein Ngar_c31750 [Candidatus Nitrososphaera gargensis Ga9.2]|uniref:Uncharacterized protein n=1 Tax=Nitrososphaera gargensis (strain Ga9.2) TaxID=1237085 RepID=K0IFE4_NITGG|nr:hypothetical protein [Candidatus Nitrososphaera gargensis]AFU60091.1 hypothetical protein Ngar_c31750 [Candidatus Nitrososphaera gargensis Ga9.2]
MPHKVYGISGEKAPAIHGEDESPLYFLGAADADADDDNKPYPSSERGCCDGEPESGASQGINAVQRRVNRSPTAIQRQSE